MKNLILITVLAFAISAQAQQKRYAVKSNSFSPEEMATLQSKRMTLNLDLTKVQQQEVHQLLLEKFELRQAKINARSDEKEKPTKADKYQRMNASLDQKIETKSQLKSILTEAQYKKWERSLNQNKKKSARKSKA